MFSYGTQIRMETRYVVNRCYHNLEGNAIQSFLQASSINLLQGKDRRNVDGVVHYWVPAPLMDAMQTSVLFVEEGGLEAMPRKACFQIGHGFDPNTKPICLPPRDTTNRCRDQDYHSRRSEGDGTACYIHMPVYVTLSLRGAI